MEPARRTPVLLVATLCALAGFLACEEETIQPAGNPGVPAPPLDSPRAVLAAVQSAYEGRDLAAYLRALDPDFTFRYLDEGGGADTLDRATMQARTTVLFQCADEIAVHFGFRGPEPSKVPGFPASAGFQMIRAAVIMLITDFGADSSDANAAVVNGAPSLFVFRPNNPDAPSRWSLVHQEDLGIPVATDSLRCGSWAAIQLGCLCP